MKWFLALCSVIFLTALAVPLTSAANTDIDAPREAVVDDGNKTLVDQWFAIIEGALTDLSTTRGRWEDVVQPDGSKKREFVEPGFGMSRIPTIQGHGLSRDYRRLGDTTQVNEILEGSGLQMAILGYGNGYDPMTAKNFKPKYFARGMKQDEAEAIEAFVRDSYKSITTGVKAFKKIGSWDVETRVVRLNKPECLNCHIDSKLNDPAAIFAFATAPK